MFSTQSFIKPAHKIALNLGYSPDTYSSSLQTSNQTFKHGNSLKPGQLSLSRLLGNAAALAACWPPPPVFSCQDLNLWGHLEGETCFSKPVPLLLHCIWSAFDQGSMVTLPDTLAVGTTLAVLPEIMCREKKMLQLQRQPQRHISMV